MTELNVKDLKTRKKSRKKRKVKQQELEGNMEDLFMDEVAKHYGDLKWAWDKWFPIGHVSMLVGPQVTGKSYLAASLISVFTGADPNWPNGTPYEGRTGKVILVETEQMRGEYVTRLRRMGVGDRDVVFPRLKGHDPTYVPDIVTDLEDITLQAMKHDAVALIIDSLSGGHGLNERKEIMRKLLKALAQTAGSLQVPLIAVHHPRKTAYNEHPKVTIDRVRGSNTITQFCRSLIGTYRLVDDLEAPVRVEVVKPSFCKAPEPFGFTVDDDGLHFQEAPVEEHLRNKLDEAIMFLIDVLEDGPVASKRVHELADEANVKYDTMNRAAKSIRVSKSSGLWSLGQGF